MVPVLAGSGVAPAVSPVVGSAEGRLVAPDPVVLVVPRPGAEVGAGAERAPDGGVVGGTEPSSQGHTPPGQSQPPAPEPEVTAPAGLVPGARLALEPVLDDPHPATASAATAATTTAARRTSPRRLVGRGRT